MVGNVDGVASVVLVVRKVGRTLTGWMHLVALVVEDEEPDGQAQQLLFLRSVRLYPMRSVTRSMIRSLLISMRWKRMLVTVTVLVLILGKQCFF